MITIAETIRGINVVIGAETTGLSKALSDVNKQSRDIQSELKQVEKLLKLDPQNTELLAQKQKLLGDAVANTREKLDRLKTAQEQVNDQFAKGQISEGQYRAFQREVAKTEQDLAKLESQFKDTDAAAKKLDVDIKGVGDKLKGVGTAMSVGVTAPLVAGFAAVTQGTKELRGDLATLQTNAKVAGQDMGILNEAMVKLQAVTGETDSNVEGLSELLATGFRDEQLSKLLDSLYGASIKFKDTLKFEGIADGLQETLATGAAVGPFAELLERSGIVLDGFNAGLKAAIANGTEQQYVLDVLAKTGLAQTYEAYRKNNEEMIKAEEANFRMQQSMAKLGATLEPILTPIINKITELVNKFNEMDPAGQKIVLVIAGIVAAIGPALIAIGSMVTGFTSVAGVVGKLAPKLASLVLGMGPIGIAIAAVVAAGILLYKNWDNITAKAHELRVKLGEAWEAVKAKTNEVWDGIKEFFKKWGTDLLLIAVGPGGWSVLLAKTLAQNWESIKQTALNIWNAIKTGISNVWGGIISAVAPAALNLYNTVKSKLEDLWSYIKSIPSQSMQWGRDIIKTFVDGIKSIHIPLPHIGVTWDAYTVAGKNIKVPDFDLNWYASGGIFTSPTVAGIGDVPEAVMPLSKLPGLMTEALTGAIQRLGNTMQIPAMSGGVNINIESMTVRNDSDIKAISRELYNLQLSALRGRGV